MQEEKRKKRKVENRLGHVRNLFLEGPFGGDRPKSTIVWGGSFQVKGKLSHQVSTILT